MQTRELGARGERRILPKGAVSPRVEPGLPPPAGDRVPTRRQGEGGGEAEAQGPTEGTRRPICRAWSRPRPAHEPPSTSPI